MKLLSHFWIFRFDNILQNHHLNILCSLQMRLLWLSLQNCWFNDVPHKIIATAYIRPIIDVSATLLLFFVLSLTINTILQSFCLCVILLNVLVVCIFRHSNLDIFDLVYSIYFILFKFNPFLQCVWLCVFFSDDVIVCIFSKFYRFVSNDFISYWLIERMLFKFFKYRSLVYLINTWLCHRMPNFSMLKVCPNRYTISLFFASGH